MTLRPPISTLFPYTTLFRSGIVTISYNGHPKVIYNLAPKTADDMARGMAILAKMWFSIGAKSVVTSHRDVPELRTRADIPMLRSEEHTSELQSRLHLVCRLL